MPILIRRKLLESYVWSVDKVSRSTPLPSDPKSIFIVEPGHIGDLLVNTPLFEALHRRFPAARVTVCAGPWNEPTVRNNPYVSEFVPLNFPWNNKFVQPQGLKAAMKFIYRSPEVRALATRRFDVGIDLLGTQFDVLLMMKLSIGYRIGIRGGGHGHSGMHQSVPFDYGTRMGKMALQLGQLLGAKDLPPILPQIYLTDAERTAGDQFWDSSPNASVSTKRRIVIAPAAGMLPRCWPHASYIKTAQMLIADGGFDVVLVGGDDAAELTARIAAEAPGVRNLCGKLGLRQTFGLIAAGDVTLSNANMVLHVASSFGVPAVVVLSDSTPLTSLEYDLWGHDTARMFGKDAVRKTLYTAEEIVEIICNTPKRIRAV